MCLIKSLVNKHNLKADFKLSSVHKMGCAAVKVEADPCFVSDLNILFLNWQDEIRIVLLGKSGVGKSETGSGILGDRYAFKYESSFCPVTKTCSRKRTVKFGDAVVYVTDTPGIKNSGLGRTKTSVEEITKCLEMNPPGPNVFLFVLRADVRFMEEDVDALNAVEKLFGEDIYKYMIIVFTRGRELDESDHSVEEKVNEMPDEFQKLYQKCRGRYVTIENPGPCAAESDYNYLTRDRERQKCVRNLFEIIYQLLCDNNWSHYSSHKGANVANEE